MILRPLQPTDEAGVEALIAKVAIEYPEQIYSPNRRPLSEIAAEPGKQYWVCVADNIVMGCVGVWLIGNANCVLKSMFVDSSKRGSGIANQLLDTATTWAMQHGALRMYLGTMTQFKAAQRFYEKLGFDKIEEEQLPTGFPANPVDKVFYTKAL
jgi:N-acetylglutamate synthase-like GNAT family acetyltransferase